MRIQERLNISLHGTNLTLLVEREMPRWLPHANVLLLLLLLHAVLDEVSVLG